MRDEDRPLRSLEFIGSSRKDLIAFSDEARQDVGHALFLAQQGDRAPGAKVLKGFGGGGVVEVVEDHEGDTYRCVYTVRLQHAVYVLHAFKKKSKRGAETPKHDMDLIRLRLRDAEPGLGPVNHRHAHERSTSLQPKLRGRRAPFTNSGCRTRTSSWSSPA